MSAETATLTVRVYRTPAGQPTCATDFESGAFCQFVRTKRFGTVDMCIACPGEPDLIRGAQGIGFLVPAHGCPVWPAKSEGAAA